MKSDVFISHASEDKESVARPLYQALIREGVSAWLDEVNITLGDSLRRTIDKALANSRYGVVILSPDFFRKEWPAKELDALVSKETGRDKVILPIRHQISHDEVKRLSPLLADKLSVSTSQGLHAVVAAIVAAVQSPEPSLAPATPIETSPSPSFTYHSDLSQRLIGIARQFEHEFSGERLAAEFEAAAAAAEVHGDSHAMSFLKLFGARINHYYEAIITLAVDDNGYVDETVADLLEHQAVSLKLSYWLAISNLNLDVNLLNMKARSARSHIAIRFLLTIPKSLRALADMLNPKRSISFVSDSERIRFLS